MSKNWASGTLADIVHGNPDKATAIRGLERFRYIDISCLSSAGIARAELIPQMDAVASPSRAQRLVLTGDILVGTVRPERMARGLVAAELHGEVASSGICVLRPKLASDASFVFGVVRDPSFTEWCVNHSTGTSYPAVAPADILRFPLRLPPPRERQRIAEVLGVLDDRIKQASYICELLAHSAHCILAMAPSTCSVSEVASVERFQWYPQKNPGQIVDHYSLPAFDTRGEPERVSAVEIASNKFLVRESRVLFSRLNPDTNRTWLCVPAKDVDASVCSTEYAVLAPTGTSVGLLWATMSSGEVGNQLAAATTGTSASHQRVNEEAVLGATIGDPRSLKNTEQSMVEGYVEALLVKRSEIILMREARDFLLPRLLSGELRVDSAEEKVGIAP